MTKKHLKRHKTPKTWPIIRKKSVFITRPLPGAHPLRKGMSIASILIEILKVADTCKDVKYILNNRNILINKKRIKNHRYIAGLLDTVTLEETKQSYRVVLDKKGKLNLMKINEKEANLILCKIMGKTLRKGGKMQLNLDSGRNIITNENYGVGNALLIRVPKQEIADQAKLEKNSHIYLTSGRYVGTVAIVKDISQKNIAFSPLGSDDTYETLKEYAYPIGKKPLISVTDEPKPGN
ncbi:MAG: hypothetical protein ABH879_00955 [archaeon]